MHRNGKKEVATAILTWLKKTATISEEKGMYWANNRRGSDYFTSPIDTHCLLMSVFNEIAPDTQHTNRMKQWLLNQKRTQNWESVPATVNAIYALLLTGSDWLNTQNTCVATWDGKTYSTAEGEIATGYLKTILPNEPANSSANPVLSIRKEGNTPAWGAVYEQYFQEIDKVKGQKGVLSVEKKLFVETNNGTNCQIRPVTPEQPLRIGDKVIVRLTIRTDREMNYVFLKDLRAGCFEPADQLSGRNQETVSGITDPRKTYPRISSSIVCRKVRLSWNIRSTYPVAANTPEVSVRFNVCTPRNSCRTPPEKACGSCPKQAFSYNARSNLLTMPSIRRLEWAP